MAIRIEQMRSGNPALTAGTFTDVRARPGDDVMTIEGTANKTAISLVLVVLAATWAWNVGRTDPAALSTIALVGSIGGLAVAIATIVRRAWAPVTTPVYAVLEGLVLGSVSVAADARFPGIAAQAVFLTFGTMGALLFAYRTGLVRASERMRAGLVAATGGIMLVYLTSFVLSFFGRSIPVIHSATPLGIAFSLLVVGVAAFNLVLDFDFIERGVAARAPKSMEWYGAFGLLVTLVWLYLELLRLLAKLQERD